MEELSLEPLNPSALFNEITVPIPPIQPPPFKEGEENLEGLELSAEESEKAEEAEEEAFFQPQDITWEYLKGLEKIPLLTPEKEVDLAKRIKEGERQVKVLEIKTTRMKAQLSPSQIPRNGAKHKPKGGNGNKSKSAVLEAREKTLLYKKMTGQYQQALRDTQKAKNELIQANLRLVVSIAKRYANRGLSFLDLIQEGNLGLIQAMVKFDYTKGYKFSTYASWWIRAAILRPFRRSPGRFASQTISLRSKGS